MKNRNLHKVHFLVILLIFLFSLAACYKMLFTEGFILYGDFTLPTSLQRFFDMHYPLWNQYGSTNSFEFISRLPFRAGPILFANFLGVSAELFYKIMVLGTMILSGLSMYFTSFYLCSSSDKNRKACVVGAFAASLIYMFNFKAIHTIIWPTLHFAYAIAPITLFSFIKLTLTPRLKYVLIVTFLMTLIAGSPHYLVFITLLLLFWLVYYTVIQKFKNINLQSMKSFCVLILLLILMNSFWLLPYTYSTISATAPRPSTVVTDESINMLSRNSEIINTLRLADIWWQHSSLAPENELLQQIWIFSSFLVPILAFSSLFASKKESKKYSIFFNVISVIIIFLGTGTNNIYPILYSQLALNLPFGWLLRAPNKLTMILAMTYSFSCGITLTSFFNKKWRKATIITVVSLMTFTVSVVPMASGYLYGVFTPVQVPQEYYNANGYVSSISQYKILWLPLSYSGNIAWAPQKLVGPFDVRSSSMPTISSFNLYSKNYLGYVLRALLENRSRDINKLLAALNVKYIIFHDDTSSFAQYNISKLLEIQKNMTLQERYGFIYIFENPTFANITNILRTNILVSGGLDKLISIAAIDSFNSIHSSLFFLDQAHLENKIVDGLFLTSNILIVDTSTQGLVLFPCSKQYLVVPFDATNHHNPSRLWSKAMTDDPLHGGWHPYLEKFGLENEDFDYSEGLVFTWASAKLKEKNPTPNNKDIINYWTFNSTNDLNTWKNYTHENQFGALYTLTLDNNSLKAELYNSTWGWKTINSPLIPVEYDDWYRWELQIKGENVHKAHIKIVEYNQERKIITVKQLKSVDPGSFDWQVYVIDYTPENTQTKYIQLQVWHDHENTQQLLPSIIWIDNVKVYDLQRFVEPVTLEIPFTLPETNEYVFLTRFFQNQKGGKIQIQLDNKNYVLNTKDQFNKFLWKQIDTIQLEKGHHKITLTNLQGFNAVNLFELIPEQEYKNIQNQIEQTLQNKRIIYILEAESDLYHQNSTISNKYGGEASNGQILILNQNSTVWQNIIILKLDQYKIAIRSKGPLQIRIHNQTYTTNSTTLKWNYVNTTLPLNKGNHKIQITTPNNAELDAIWLYSTQNPNETLQDIFTTKQKPAHIVNYTRIDSTKYIVKINATKPFMLSFAEAYDPLWVCYVNGEKISSIPLYSVINGFWINQTGNLDILIEYEPQRWFYIGSIVSITTFLACTAYLTHSYTKIKHTLQKIKQKLKK